MSWVSSKFVFGDANFFCSWGKISTSGTQLCHGICSHSRVTHTVTISLLEVRANACKSLIFFCHRFPFYALPFYLFNTKISSEFYCKTSESQIVESCVWFLCISQMWWSLITLLVLLCHFSMPTHWFWNSLMNHALANAAIFLLLPYLWTWLMVFPMPRLYNENFLTLMNPMPLCTRSLLLCSYVWIVWVSYLEKSWWQYAPLRYIADVRSSPSFPGELLLWLLFLLCWFVHYELYSFSLVSNHWMNTCSLFQWSHQTCLLVFVNTMHS